jgi:tetratricopeptide (TPR) repeat protein
MSVVRVGSVLLFALVIRPMFVGVSPSVEAAPQRPSVGELLARYDRGEYREALDQTDRIKDPRGFARDWEETAEAWSVAGTNDAEVASRRLTAASFALEVAHALHASSPSDRRALLERACGFLRRLPPSGSGDRLWYLASIALAQQWRDGELLLGIADRSARALQLETRAAPHQTTSHLAHALARYQDDSRLALAKVVIADDILFLRAALESNRSRIDRARPTEVSRRADGEVQQLADDLLRQYADLMRLSDVRAEATLRRGAVARLMGDAQQGLDHFGQVPALTEDRYLIYLSHLFRGQLLDERNEASDAAKAYKASLEAMPSSWSAGVLLASALFRSGNRSDSFDIAQTLLRVGGRSQDDPSRLFRLGDYRLWPTYIDSLRRRAQ